MSHIYGAKNLAPIIFGPKEMGNKILSKRVWVKKWGPRERRILVKINEMALK